jgi:hypothetical protein
MPVEPAYRRGNMIGDVVVDIKEGKNIVKV